MLQDRENCRTLARVRQFGTLALLAGAVVLSGHTAVSADSPFEKWSLRPLCALWDGQAGEAIARRITESNPRDTDLRPIGDDLFRMQRARRSCDLGQIRAACQDYIAIMRNVGGRLNDWQGSSFVCPPAMADEPRSGRQQTRASNE